MLAFKKLFIPSFKKFSVSDLLSPLEFLDLNWQTTLLNVVQICTSTSRVGACSFYHTLINAGYSILKNYVQLDMIFSHNHFIWQFFISEAKHLFFICWLTMNYQGKHSVQGVQSAVNHTRRDLPGWHRSANHIYIDNQNLVRSPPYWGENSSEWPEVDWPCKPALMASAIGRYGR